MVNVRGTDRDDVHDSSPDFCYAVSLLAAMEGAIGMAGHEEVLPFLGMARAELVEFGQRRPAYLIALEPTSIRSGLCELQDRLTALLAESTVLRHSLRVDAARAHVRRGLSEAT